MASVNKWNVFNCMTRESVAQILSAIGGVRVALIGDLCLDAYWKADMTRSELSLETPHFPLPIVEERYFPGGGGNTAANIAALAPRYIHVIGTIGQDWRGDVLMKELIGHGIGVSCIIRRPDRITNAFIKPCRRGISEVVYEDPRLDFANHTPHTSDLDGEVAAELEKASSSIDVLCVSDQLQNGCITAPIRERIIKMAKEGLKVVVDSRYRIGQFSGCFLKPNELEGATAIGAYNLREQPDMAGIAAIAKELARRAGSPVCMTLGDRGCLVAQEGALTHISAIILSPPLDICGAGDTFLAAFSCALAAGASSVQAAYIANLASSVTVKKINQTGTASREEILSRCGGRAIR